VEEVLPVVVKKDGRREPFDRIKIVSGIKKACEKRPVSTDTIEAVVESIERRCQEFQDKEIPSKVVGEAVMQELQKLDGIAYVRFASVYREFRDVTDFFDELKDIIKKEKTDKKEIAGK
jgi:transcriptional repressor NrdR